MNTEQKARAYDRAIKRAKKWYDANTNEGYRGIFEDIFPELKESEDEKVKRILHSISSKMSSHLREIFTEEEFQCFDAWSNAWLEKQGEQTHAKLGQLEVTKTSDQELEPKFHEGEWVVYKCGKETVTLQITRIVGETYVFSDDSTLGVVDEYTLRLWDVTKHAKDGDVLVTGDWVFIFGKLNTNDKPVCYCHYDVEFGFSIDVNTYISTFSTIHPATKEQRDTLMKAMADAGYTFDFEKKELKKIEEKHAENKGMNLVEEEMTPFQKKVFSIIDTAIEEEQGLKQVCDELFTLASNEIKQKPAEWSEEDERKINRVYSILRQAADTHAFSTSCRLIGDKECIELQDFLKSLRPQYHWKPTEKQLYMLNWLATNVLDDGVTGKPAKEVLYSLYEQLKQL